MHPFLKDAYFCPSSVPDKRKFPKNYYLNVWNVSDPIVEVNVVVRHFRQPWVLIRKIGNKCVKILKVKTIDTAVSVVAQDISYIMTVGLKVCRKP
jgi:hypothetical protein